MSAMSRFWIVHSKDSGKVYGPFLSAHAAGKWATKTILGHWMIIRLRKP